MSGKRKCESVDEKGGKNQRCTDVEWALLFSALITNTGFASDIIPIIIGYCHDRYVRFDREDQYHGIQLTYLPCCGGATISLDSDVVIDDRYLAIASSPVSKIESNTWSMRIDSYCDADKLVFGVADKHLKANGTSVSVCSREFLYRHSRFIWSDNHEGRNQTDGIHMTYTTSFA